MTASNLQPEPCRAIYPYVLLSIHRLLVCQVCEFASVRVSGRDTRFIGPSPLVLGPDTLSNVLSRGNKARFHCTITDLTRSYLKHLIIERME
jgi:hypothetical protein